MLGFIPMQALWEQIKAGGSFLFVDGKGDSAISSKIDNVLSPDKGALPTSIPHYSTKVSVTVTAKDEHSEALAIWPINEDDDWKTFLDTHLPSHPILADSLEDLDHAETGFAFVVSVSSEDDIAGLSLQLAEAFPLVSFAVEPCQPEEIITSINPFLCGSSSDLAEILISLMPTSTTPA